MTGAGDMGALLRITELAEKLGGLDTREGEHFGQLTEKLGGLAEAVRGTDARLGRHTQILAAMDGLDQQVIELARHVAALSESQGGGEDDDEDEEDGPKPYRAAPSARWWELRGDERAAAVARLQAWVEDIYLPGYGQLAAALPECWTEHDLCLYSLDALAEFWMVLYLNPKRSTATLAGQAEWQTRILPLYVAQMAAEARRCEHSAQRGWAGR
jgi:hypothetical protein